ncbi:MAG: hypothetical protein P8J70_09720 [Glaciecola sp.]|nr:hypothetical protein [Glaciecola sp.]MDG1815324.1 hypothetical protein [Glaciecola sp.]MDG2099936.1 hypothetical protein [Glaciecola sp.]
MEKTGLNWVEGIGASAGRLEAIDSFLPIAQYKWGTFSLRLERRMQVKRVTSLKAYHEILRNDESEIKAMRNEQLIPVLELVAKADEQEGIRV